MVTFSLVNRSRFIGVGDSVYAIALLPLEAFSVTAARTMGSLGRESVVELRLWRTKGDVILVGESSDTNSGIPSDIAWKFGLSVAFKANNIITAGPYRDGNLVLASWQMAASGHNLRRMSDSGDQGRFAEFVNIRSVDSPNTITDFVTSVKDDSGNLRLIAWKLDAITGRLTRLGDSQGQGDPSDLVDSTVLDNTVVTVIRTNNGNFKILSWLISSDGSQIDLLAHTSDEEKGIGEIAIAGSITSENTAVSTVATAIRDSAGNLKLMHWLLTPGGTAIKRGDSILEDGQHNISITQCSDSRFVTMSEGKFGGLRLFAFDIDAAGKFHRVGQLIENRGLHEPAGHHSIVTNNAVMGDLTTVSCHHHTKRQLVVTWKLEE